QPDTLPSARVLATMQGDFGGSYTGFIGAQGEQTRNHLLGLPWSADSQAGFEALAASSVAERLALEAADRIDFETYRQAYLQPERLQALPLT
ncbi:MAG: glutamate--cysteine ligase, partial [Chitinophagaceae bacterium]|nr:glutamate--cysteine ligase [Rubrivivax sp.]